MHYWTQCIIYFESFIHLTFRFLHVAVTTSVRADLQKIQNHENQYNDCEKSVFNIQRICCIFSQFHEWNCIEARKGKKISYQQIIQVLTWSWILTDDTHATKFTHKNNRQALTMVSAVQQKKTPSRAVCLFELMNKSRIMTIKTTFAHHVLLLFFLVKFFLCLNTNN